MNIGEIEEKSGMTRRSMPDRERFFETQAAGASASLLFIQTSLRKSVTF